MHLALFSKWRWCHLILKMKLSSLKESKMPMKDDSSDFYWLLKRFFSISIQLGHISHIHARLRGFQKFWYDIRKICVICDSSDSTENCKTCETCDFSKNFENCETCETCHYSKNCETCVYCETKLAMWLFRKLRDLQKLWLFWKLRDLRLFRKLPEW